MESEEEWGSLIAERARESVERERVMAKSEGERVYRGRVSE